MTLSDLLQGALVQASSGDLGCEVGYIRMDSRKIKPGDLFAAVKDFYRDCHEYIPQAIEAGASAILLSDEPAEELSVPWVRVHNVLELLGPICAKALEHPSRQMDMVGVTGTNGKTTTAHMIHSILSADFKKTGIAGTNGVQYGDVSRYTGLTTLEAPELQELLSEMKSDGVEAAVVEVSSHGIALKRVHGTAFTCGVFTGMGTDHLDFHADQEDYTQTKVNWLLGDVQNSPSHKGVVVPADDTAGREILSEFRGEVVTFGFDEDADIYPDQLDLVPDGTKGRLVTPEGTLTLSLKVPGRHNVRNAMAAAGAAFVMGIQPIAIVDGLQQFTGVPGRLESVPNSRGINVYVDYAHTPDALDAVTASLKELGEGRLITVFGCGGDRDKAKRSEMGRIVSTNSDVAIVTSDNPRSEDPNKIVEEIVTGIAADLRDQTIFVEVDRAKAIAKAVSLATEGDTILIAGKGHETQQIIGDQSNPFDDRKVAAEVMAS